MFGKKEKKEQADQQQREAKVKLEPYEIRVMPPKFHKFLGAKKSNFAKILIVIIVLFIVIVGGLLAAYYFYYLPSLNTNTNQPSVVQPPVNNTNLNENDNTNTNVNVNINENANTNDTDLNVNANENNNVNINDTNNNQNDNTNTNDTNVNVNDNININQPPADDNDDETVTYVSSLDSDSDDLTDVEEDLYDTEKRRPDTDADGFIDGQEIINGYNPLAAGSSLLETSGAVNEYSNFEFNYKILYLNDWLARPTDQSQAEVIFQSATGEAIEIIVEDNLQERNLVEWYVAQSPLADIGDLTRITRPDGLEVLISADQLTYYFADPDDLSRIYVLNYNTDARTSLNFLTTFKMMTNSFQLVESAEEEGEE